MNFHKFRSFILSNYTEFDTIIMVKHFWTKKSSTKLVEFFRFKFLKKLS